MKTKYYEFKIIPLAGPRGEKSSAGLEGNTSGAFIYR